jgi:hypothetical protein
MGGDRDLDASGYYHILKSTRELPITQWTHVEVTGVVQAVLHEEDGDLHLRITDGSVKVCGKKEYASGQCIVAEARPGTVLPRGLPTVGDRITVRGISRYDRQHSWSEVHPLDSFTILK